MKRIIFIILSLTTLMAITFQCTKEQTVSPEQRYKQWANQAQLFYSGYVSERTDIIYNLATNKMILNRESRNEYIREHNTQWQNINSNYVKTVPYIKGTPWCDDAAFLKLLVTDFISTMQQDTIKIHGVYDSIKTTILMNPQINIEPWTKAIILDTLEEMNLIDFLAGELTADPTDSLQWASATSYVSDLSPEVIKGYLYSRLCSYSIYLRRLDDTEVIIRKMQLDGIPARMIGISKLRLHNAKYGGIRF